MRPRRTGLGVKEEEEEEEEEELLVLLVLEGGEVLARPGPR